MDVEAYIEAWIERNVGEEDTLSEFASHSDALLRDLDDAGLLLDQTSARIQELSRTMIANRLREQSSSSDYAAYLGGGSSDASDEADEDEDMSDLSRD